MDQDQNYTWEPPAGSWAPAPGGGQPSDRRRPVRRGVLALVGVAALSGIGAGVAAAATSGGSGTTPGANPGAASGTTPGAAPGTAPGGGPGRAHFGFGPGGMGPGGMGPGGMAARGFAGMGPGGALHGEFVRPAPGGSGYQTVDVQSGTVTAVSSGSITVQSKDGFSRTYDVTTNTLVDAGRDGISNVKNNDEVTLTAVVGNGTPTATNIMDRTNLASIRQAWGG